MQIGKLTAVLGVDMTQFKQGMARASAQMKKVGRQMQSTGKTLTTSLTLPLAALGAVSFKAYKEFDANMSKITGLVGVASEQVDEWRKNLIAMAPALGKSPKELSDAMFFVTSAGLRGAEALETLKISAQASAAGLGETKTIADLVTSAMTAYGSENLNAAQATDILVGTVREGKAESSQLAAVMGQVLPIASEMGVSFDQVGASIAAMTRSGTEASQASTQLKAIMVSLMKPTQQAEDAMTDMGTSSAELRDMMGKKGLFATLEHIKELTGDYGKEMAEIFPNVRALSGALDLMGKNAEDNGKIFEALTDSTGSLDKAFEEATQTAEYRWNKSMAEMQTAFTTIGGIVQGVILPVFEKLSESFLKLSQWLGGLNDTQKKWVLGITTAVAALGPMLVILGKLGTAIPGLITGIARFGKAFKMLTITMMANPIIAIATAIAALGVIMYTVAKKTNAFSTAQSRATKAVRNANAEYQTQKKAASDMITKLNVLNTRENLSNSEKREQSRLISEINTKYGSYLDNKVSDVSTTEELALAMKNVNIGLRNSILIKKIEKQQTQIMNDALDKQQKKYEKIDKKLKSMGYRDVAERVKILNDILADPTGYEFGDLLERTGINIDNLTDKEYRVMTFAKSYARAMNIAEEEIKALDEQLNALLITEESVTDKSHLRMTGGGFGGGNQWDPNASAPPDRSDYLEQLSWEKKLIGKTEAEQRAMNIAKQNGIAIGSAEYQTILAKVQAMEAERKSLKKGLNAQQERKKAFDKQMSQMDFEISLLDETKIQQEALTLAREYGIDKDSEQFDMIVKKVTALQAEKEETESLAAVVAAHSKDMEFQIALLGKTAVEQEAMNFARQNGITMIDKETGKMTEEYAQILNNTQAYHDLARVLKTKQELQTNVDSILDSLMTEEQAIAQSYDNKIALLQTAIDQEIGEKERLKDAIVQLEKEKQAAIISSTEKQTKALNKYEQVAHGAIMGMTTAIGTAIVDQEKGFRMMADLVIDSISNIITMLLAEAAAAIIMGETMKFGFWGLALAAVGIAALSAMWSQYKSQNMQGLASGGEVTRSGSFLVGEEGPEVVSLQAGSAVTPNHMLGGFEMGTLETRISGRDLMVILNRNEAQERRR